jgi:DNA-binding protein H-NS
MFLSQETRVLCPGTHGLRFTPPEVVQQLQKIQECLQAGTNNGNSTGSGKTATGNDIFKAINTTGKLTFESALGIYGPYLPSFSTDVYAIGAVALVLLSEKQLFPNVGSESGVKAQLLSGQIPIVPYSYPDQELLKSFQEQVVNTTVTLSSHIRPAASALVKIIEKEYVDLASKISMVEVTKREEQMKQVEQEIAELDIKVAQHEMLVSKGKELIGKKEQEKSKIFDGKQKREHEASIEKARMKLIAFQDELEGLKEDKFGAEQDL